MQFNFKWKIDDPGDGTSGDSCFLGQLTVVADKRPWWLRVSRASSRPQWPHTTFADEWNRRNHQSALKPIVTLKVQNYWKKNRNRTYIMSINVCMFFQNHSRTLLNWDRRTMRLQKNEFEINSIWHVLCYIFDSFTLAFFKLFYSVSHRHVMRRAETSIYIKCMYSFFDGMHAKLNFGFPHSNWGELGVFSFHVWLWTGQLRWAIMILFTSSATELASYNYYACLCNSMLSRWTALLLKYCLARAAELLNRCDNSYLAVWLRCWEMLYTISHL